MSILLFYCACVLMSKLVKTSLIAVWDPNLWERVEVPLDPISCAHNVFHVKSTERDFESINFPGNNLKRQKVENRNISAKVRRIFDSIRFSFRIQ